MVHCVICICGMTHMQVQRSRATFDVLLTTYELIMAPADGQRLSRLHWSYVMCAETQPPHRALPAYPLDMYCRWVSDDPQFVD